MLRLEQVKTQLKPENYAIWLQQEAAKHDVPEYIIGSELAKLGIFATETAAPVQEEAATEEEVVVQEEAVVTGTPTVKQKRPYNKRGK